LIVSLPKELLHPRHNKHPQWPWVHH